MTWITRSSHNVWGRIHSFTLDHVACILCIINSMNAEHRSHNSAMRLIVCVSTTPPTRCIIAFKVEDALPNVAGNGRL